MKISLPSTGSLRGILPTVGIVAAFASGAIAGVEIGLLVAAFVALSMVIAFLWASVQSLSGDSPLTFDEAMTLGQPSAEEEQKRAVLRALKDLDYERSVGKISDQDYRELSARYREEAKRLIELVDENLAPARERAEKLLANRIARDERSKKKRAEKEADGAEDAAHTESDAPPSSGPKGEPAERDKSSDDEEYRP
jgi:hypothetical protein